MNIKELHERLKGLGVNVPLATVDEFLRSRNIAIEDVTDSVVSQIAADFKDQAGSALATAPKAGKAAKATKRSTRGDRAQESAPALHTSLTVLSQKTSNEIEAIVDVAEQGVNHYVKHTASRLADIFQEAPNNVLKELGVLAVEAQSDADSFRAATRAALAGTVFALNDDAA